MACFTLPDIVNIVKPTGDQPRNGKLLDDIVDEIIKSFEDIIAWLNYNLDYKLSMPTAKDPQSYLEAYVRNADVLRSLVELSPRILNALYASSRATDFVTKVWVTRSQDNIHTRMTISRQQCPILVLLLHCITPFAGKQVFSDKARAYQHDGLPELFLHGVAHRMRVWKGLVEAKKIRPEDAAMHYLDLCDVVNHLLSKPVFQRAAVNTGIWDVMIPPIGTMEKVARPELILACINHVVSAAVLISATRVRNFYTLLQNGDILSTFFRVVEKSLNPDSVTMAVLIVQMLVKMCCFPEVPDWLSVLINVKLQKAAWKLEDHRQKELRMHWRVLIDRINVGGLVLYSIRGELHLVPSNTWTRRSNRGPTAICFCDNASASV